MPVVVYLIILLSEVCNSAIPNAFDLERGWQAVHTWCCSNIYNSKLCVGKFSSASSELLTFYKNMSMFECHTLVSPSSVPFINFQTRNSWKLAPSKGVGIERAIKATPAGFVDTVPTVDQPWKANVQVCDVPDCSCNISSSVLSYVSFYFLYFSLFLYHPFDSSAARFVAAVTSQSTARLGMQGTYSIPLHPHRDTVCNGPFFTLFLFIVSRPAELSF